MPVGINHNKPFNHMSRETQTAPRGPRFSHTQSSTAQERKKAMTTGKALNGKPYAGNPHVRFDEGEVASAATPPLRRLPQSRRGSSLLSCLSPFLLLLKIGCVKTRAARRGLRLSTHVVKGFVVVDSNGQDARCPSAVRQCGGGYLCHARTRHGASVCGYTRRRFRCRSLPPHWRHLRFTIQRRWSPKEYGRYYSTSFYDLSIPPRGVFCARRR